MPVAITVQPQFSLQKKLALLNLRNACKTREALLKIKGVRAASDQPFFNEFTLVIDKDPAKLKENLRKNKILGPLALSSFYPDKKSQYLFAVTENRTDEELKRLVKAVEES